MHASNDKWRQATRPFQSFQKPGLHDLGSLVIAQQDHIDSYIDHILPRYTFDAAYVLRCEFHCGWELTCSILQHPSEASQSDAGGPAAANRGTGCPKNAAGCAEKKLQDLQICQDNPRRDCHSLVHVKSC